jgi:hypothetical protein
MKKLTRKFRTFAVCTIFLGIFLEAEAGTFYAIILTGGKSAEEAQQGVDRFKTLDYPYIKLAKGFPMVRSSDLIKGLNPGYMISLAGFCSEQRNATTIKNLMSLDFIGAYIRSVHGDYSNLCPTIIPVENNQPLRDPNATEHIWPLKKGVAGISWHAYFETEEQEGGCAPATIHLLVRLHGITLAETVFSEECSPNSKELDDETGEPLVYGGGIKYTLSLATLGDLNFVDVFSSETGEFDDVLVKRSLWGFLCGRLIEIPYGTNDYTTADGEDQIQTVAKGASAWKHLLISGTNGGHEEFEKKMDWDEENCEFVETGLK